MLIFDIETGPSPREQLDRFLPDFTADKRLKDPDKIRADLQTKTDDWYERAALSAVTGQVVAIGYCYPDSDEPRVVVNGIGENCGGEQELLELFWAEVRASRQESIVGFNITGFDLPFLIRRSWKYGIPVPNLRYNRYWSSRIIELMDLWTFNNREQRDSLDTISKFLGLGAKPDGITGADFSRLWAGGAGSPDRLNAIAYLKNDVELTYKLYRRLCC